MHVYMLAIKLIFTVCLFGDFDFLTSDDLQTILVSRLTKVKCIK